MHQCGICHSQDLQCIYDGQIRTGQVGQLSKQNHKIWQCSKCQSARLDGTALDYESAEYRRSVNGDESIATYYQKHDGDQLQRLQVIGSADLRGKVVADLGCGAGSFLDFLKGMAGQTIAIEPAKSYREELVRKGHKTYSYCENALGEWRGKVDLAVSFAVIEHLQDPLKFLREMRELLSPTGKALISTPNAQDWLLQALPQDYPQFFYRQAHLWYFNQTSITEAARLAGFKDSKIIYQHQYDLANALLWLRDKKPTGKTGLAGFEAMNSHWANHLEQAGTANYLYAWLKP